ncbi:MAG: calcium/proton exchanger [Abitibacteriaceae bacterium]|nr:calcium/proton exchanger [Abditibacteriaceae bacterium]
MAKGLTAHLARNELITVGLAVIATIASAILTFTHANAVLSFVFSAAALSLLAMLVGHATEQLGNRMGPGATGVLQSALGNLPELFVGIFSLRAGLVEVVQAALVGSILANSLLVLGLAMLFGGLRNGTQRFNAEVPRTISALIMLAVAALIIPTIAFRIHTPAAAHISTLSGACAVFLLVVFAASIPFSISGDPCITPEPQPEHEDAWPMSLTLVILTLAGIGAAFVSDWFVDALTPTIKVLHLSETFTGLVIVAIAGNAVENVVGIQLAAANKTDYAISVILNSSLQIALGLTPILVLLSFVLGGPHLTLVLPPLLVVALALTAIVSAYVVSDGESIWLEGVALIGLYGIIASAFWWG